MVLAHDILRRSYPYYYGANAFDSYVLNNLLAGNNGFYLPLIETTGAIAKNYNYKGGVGAEMFTNPGIVNGVGSVYTFTGDNPDGYVVNGELGIDPEISEVGTGEGHGGVGTGLVNIYSSGGLVTYQQNSILTIGDTYRSVVDVDTVTAGSIIRTKSTTANVGNTFNIAGIDSYDYIADDTGLGLKRGVAGTDITINGHSIKKIGELDGGYTGPTLAGDTLLGQPAPTFDGVNDYVQLEYNRLESVFDPTKGTLNAACKLSQTQAENATQYAVVSIGVDSNNRCLLYKRAANTLSFLFNSGGVSRSVDYTITSADWGKWMYPICKWDSAGNISLTVKTTTSSGAYPAGAWTASNLTAVWSVIGMVNSILPYPNAIGQVVLINRVITTGESANLYNLFKAQEPNAA